MSLLVWLKRAVYKLSGECFIFGGYPIGYNSSFETCFVLNTSCLPFWKYEKEILINIAPFVPYKELRPVKIRAYDGSKYGIRDVYGKVIDSESLEIEIAFWDQEKDRYMLQSVHYLPDTKKTFGASLGGYPDTEIELDKTWHFREKVHFEYSDKPLIDIISYISKPSLAHKVKYYLALNLAKLGNRVYSNQSKLQENR